MTDDERIATVTHERTIALHEPTKPYGSPENLCVPVASVSVRRVVCDRT